MFANKIRSRMSKPIFLTFILTLIISCATHTPNPSSWLDKRSTPVTQDSICRLISYCQTQANIEIQHGNYAEALYWKDETLRLKDTLLSVRNSSGISHTDDKLLANPVTHHHLPIYFFPYLSFPLLPPPEIESPV